MVVTMAKKGTRLIDMSLKDTGLRTFILFVQTAATLLIFAKHPDALRQAFLCWAKAGRRLTG